MVRKLIALSAALSVLTACSTVTGIFKSDKEKATAAAELTDIASPIAIRKLWSVSVGQGEAELAIRQKPVVDGDTVYAADAANQLVAIDKATGKIKWKATPNKEAASGGWKFWQKPTQPFALTGGPAVYSGLVALGGRNGEVFAFNAADGAILWKTMVSSSVISAPLITFDTVIVRANDGKVIGLDLSTGEKRWQFDRGLPSLSVRGNGSPVLGPGLIFVGYEDGTLIALRQQDGQRVWEQLVAKPDGRTEIDRMSDIDGEIQVGDREVFASSYHNSTMAIALNNGQPIWVRDIGGYAGVALLSDRIIVADRDSGLWALDRTSGSDLWKQAAFLRRGVTTPVVQGAYIVVADREGYVHWLDSATGDIKGRVKVGGGVRGSPVVSDDGTLFVQNVDGQLSAFSLAQ
ncbi:outer membrane protein assembly factor BamB [Arenimonas sp. GDDSR-1]|uniref:outer membrane protein assembly factor BamB n=1 Tax=Arenimonas sp. GDDSR-1 TaxID=2950125 RepID=UPI002612E908|nr:outer membrane protein assembly factor BamB [Arenimonas sp. GDDSR-1]